MCARVMANDQPSHISKSATYISSTLLSLACCALFGYFVYSQQWALAGGVVVACVLCVATSLILGPAIVASGF
jgi:uncharacterized membrane protein YgaE (UPF0421/DUF939 family)